MRNTLAIVCQCHCTCTLGKLSYIRFWQVVVKKCNNKTEDEFLPSLEVVAMSAISRYCLATRVQY